MPRAAAPMDDIAMEMLDVDPSNSVTPLTSQLPGGSVTDPEIALTPLVKGTGEGDAYVSNWPSLLAPNKAPHIVRKNLAHTCVARPVSGITTGVPGIGYP